MKEGEDRTRSLPHTVAGEVRGRLGGRKLHQRLTVPFATSKSKRDIAWSGIAHVAHSWAVLLLPHPCGVQWSNSSAVSCKREFHLEKQAGEGQAHPTLPSLLICLFSRSHTRQFLRCFFLRVCVRSEVGYTSCCSLSKPQSCCSFRVHPVLARSARDPAIFGQEEQNQHTAAHASRCTRSTTHVIMGCERRPAENRAPTFLS